MERGREGRQDVKTKQTTSLTTPVKDHPPPPTVQSAREREMTSSRPFI